MLKYFDINSGISIKTQYRELSKRFHPDMVGGSDSAFQEIQEEYEMLLKNPDYKEKKPHTPPNEKVKFSPKNLKDLLSLDDLFNSVVSNSEKLKSMIELGEMLNPELANMDFVKKSKKAIKIIEILKGE